MATTTSATELIIEEMPLGQNDHHDRATSYYSSDQIPEVLLRHMNLTGG